MRSSYEKALLDAASEYRRARIVATAARVRVDALETELESALKESEDARKAEAAASRKLIELVSGD